MSVTAKQQVGVFGSLERRLPLTIGALLAAVVLTFGAAAFREVRSTTREGAQQRMLTASTAAVTNVSDNIAKRATALLLVSKAPTIRTALLDPNPETLARASQQLLEDRTNVADISLQSLELRNAGGQLLASSAIGIVNSLHEVALHSTIAKLGADSVAVGDLYQVGTGHYYWYVVPVMRSEYRIGYVAERRKFVPQLVHLAMQLSALSGLSMEPYFTSASFTVWITPDGKPMKAPALADSVGEQFETRIADRDVLAVRTPIPGTPWLLVYAIEEADITGRSMLLVNRVYPFAFGLLLFGGLAGWLISRGVIRPLRTVASAADAIAAGDYSRRVDQPDDEELRQLASAFNRMAERVGTSHHELEARNEELRAAQDEAVSARIASDRARIEAQRANEAKTSFLAMMSHELRTPLSAIGGYTEILQLGLRGPLTETQLADLERIKSNQAHLLTIINDMLDLSQIESGQLSVHCEPLVLDEVLAQVEPIVAPHISKKRLTYEVDASIGGMVVFADRERLRQVLVNLVSNAARYSESGGIISIHAAAKGARVALHISDTGIGIPPEKLEAIFEPFVQVDTGPTRRSGGTGLGLPISRRLVEAMEGELTVISEIGVGSTFTLELKAAELVQKPELRLIQGRKKAIA